MIELLIVYLANFDETAKCILIERFTIIAFWECSRMGTPSALSGACITLSSKQTKNLFRSIHKVFAKCV